MTNKQSQIYNSVICFKPLFLFIAVELFYDKKYFLKYLFKRTPKGRISFSLQYTIIGIIALLVFLYNNYLIQNNDTFLDILPELANETKEKGKDKKDNIKALNKIKEALTLGILLFIVVLIGTIIYATLTKNKIKGIVVFFIYSVIGLCNLSYIYEKVRIFDNSGQVISMLDFLGKGIKINNNKEEYVKAGFSTILPGLVFGLVFGFIDNAGLISGLEALDSPFGVLSRYMTGAKLNGGGNANSVAQDMMEGTTSGLGNLFSDGLGVSIGAFYGKFASSLFPSEVQQPLWVDMVGISFGCILGIAIPISIKNLTNGNMWANGFMSFRFIKDLIIICCVITVLLTSIILLPEREKLIEEKIKNRIEQ